MKKLFAFILGAIEFRTSLTTSVADDALLAYDSGREFAHFVTLRQFEV